MADVNALATALGTALTNAGFRATDYLADTFSPPCALVASTKVTYHDAFGVNALGTYEFDVYLIVPRVSDRTAIATLQANMGTVNTSVGNSVIAALEVDGTLGGIASGVVVRESGPMANITITPTGGSGVVYTSVRFAVEVFA